MPTCGNCKLPDQSVEHIRECYAKKHATVQTVELTGLAKEYVESKDFKPMAFQQKTPVVPDSKYALYDGDGKIIFFEVRTGKGKWAHMQFVDRLIGHPGDWQKIPVKGAAKRDVLLDLDMNPQAAARRYGKHFTVCGVCGSPLSDPESMAAGIGPICMRRF